ncbi:DNA sulfur modification protein DndE [Deinococcus indicus]|uniref:DNA sulfur modification protein DndE n=1 Tax=Deinococcus indicus TaxID=223556 RepID=UPI00174D3227|nr:DNA sulfur modification protein DndE [Deinococcus indicus]
MGKEVSDRLKHLRARTGLTPNILCRLGFCLSLNDPIIPNPDDFPQDSEREIDRHTLTGSWDLFFVALLKERVHRDGLELTDEVLVQQFHAHVNRGVLLLYKRVRNVGDLIHLMPRESLPSEFAKESEEAV